MTNRKQKVEPTTKSGNDAKPIVMRCFDYKIEELQKSIAFDDQFCDGKNKDLLIDRIKTIKDMRQFIEMCLK